MKVFYFTATGNSLQVAKKIGGELISIPQIIDGENLNFKDDVIGVVFPVYFHGLPKMLKKFLENAKFEADYLFAVGTYGGFSGAAMFGAQKLAKKHGYSFDYLDDIEMVDNYIPYFDIKVEKDKEPSKKIEENLAKICNDIKNRKKLNASIFWFLKMLAWFLGKFENFFLNKNYAKNYIINEKCNKCGICAKVCPAKNITVEEKPNFSDKCEVCLACINLCPQNAIHLKKEKNNERFLNSNVKLSEIISANCRK